MIVYGTVKNENDILDFEIELQVESIDSETMPIEESSRMIISAINKKYGTRFPSRSRLNPVRIKES
ncbi:hypothetical protein [Bacillus velezensis]|uniref:hypothetical protein n=1 Tax=Bacillus velezensis TaxID=492670 RepID=UPI002DBA3C83|nr:hypothetical protein [Bacillus velezensis]MEC3772206.1 hypothetical protein [Bacillus velezensis]